MAMLAILQSDPVVGAKWSEIQCKGAVDCLAANGLITPEDLANIQFEDMKDADGAPALTKGVLGRALNRATVAGAKGEHVDVGAGLAQITQRDLPQSLWPRLLRGFAPARWRVSTVRSERSDGEPRRRVSRYWRGRHGISCASAMPTNTLFFRRVDIGARPLVAGESAPAQVALDAPLQGRKAQVALVYDRLARRTWAERAAGGVAGFQSAVSRHASARYSRARVGAQVNVAALSLGSGLLRADKEAFEKAVVVPSDVSAAIDWIAARSERQVRRERRATLERIRTRGAEPRASGATAAWFAVCDANVRAITGSINGPLLVELLDEIGYEDAACVGILAKTVAEAELGRMGHPAPISAVELDRAVLTPRFGARQTREGGSEKLRLVADMSRSRIDAASQPTERPSHEAIDALFGACKAFVARVGEAPGLWEAGIDAAFRRAPLMSEHRAFAWVAFLVGTCVYVAQHFAAAPFGLCDAMRQFAELVRIIPGPSAVADGKLLFDNLIGVLGLSVAIDERGLVCWPLPDKRAWWRAEIAAALQEGALERGRASKLAGCARQAGRPRARRGRASPCVRARASALSAHLENFFGVRVMALAGLIAQLRVVCPEARSIPVFAAAALLADDGADAVSDLVDVAVADFSGAAALSSDAREVVRAAFAAAQRGGAPAALRRGGKGAPPAPAPSPGIAPRSSRAFRVLPRVLRVGRSRTGIVRRAPSSESVSSSSTVRARSRGMSIAALNAGARTAAGHMQLPRRTLCPLPGGRSQSPGARVAETCAGRGPKLLGPVRRAVSNCVTYVRKACLVASRRAPTSHPPAARASARSGSRRARPVGVFRHLAARAAKNAIEKHSGWQAKARMALQGRDVARLVSHLRVSDEGRRFAMLCLAAYAFLLRLSSEALPAVRVENGAAAACVASAFVVGDQVIELHLSRRKNRESRSALARQCWRDECAATCPVHVLGAWLIGEPAHQPIWAARPPGAARARLRRALGEIGRHGAESFGARAFRRGRAQDIAAGGEPVTGFDKQEPGWQPGVIGVSGVRLAVESLWSRVQSKHPTTCDPQIVQQECDRIDAEDLANILQLPERAVHDFFAQAGLADPGAEEPKCQDVCQAALQAVPARNRPPLHYVAAQQITPEGDIEWAVDLTPLDLRAPDRRVRSRKSGDPRQEKEHDVDDVHDVLGTPADAQAMPSFDRQGATSTLEVATRVCEMFHMYPWSSPAGVSSFLDDAGNATRHNADAEPIPDGNGMFTICSYRGGCNGLAKASNCKWSLPSTYFPCCRCWRKPNWNSEINMLWGHARTAVLYAVWRLPSLEAAKGRLVKKFFGFEYTRTLGWWPTEEKKRAVANTQMLDWWVQLMWWKINDESVTFCYDAASDPPGISWGMAWGSKTDNRIAFTKDGWFGGPDWERVRSMLHEYYHVLGPKHGEPILMWGTNYTGPLVNAFKMDCYLLSLLEEMNILQSGGRCRELQALRAAGGEASGTAQRHGGDRTGVLRARADATELVTTSSEPATKHGPVPPKPPYWGRPAWARRSSTPPSGPSAPRAASSST
ncbi:unnamed protein product [Prorocentrum cordatum]|uniref:Uncharacterized protein n=1 Tax=Prorocentrum cordatum TaxID=2364126 RepID=A0ABN9VAF1_9DINO|nr:unnamed protein product [Polarella glacialis]